MEQTQAQIQPPSSFVKQTLGNWRWWLCLLPTVVLGLLVAGTVLLRALFYGVRWMAKCAERCTEKMFKPALQRMKRFARQERQG